MSTADACLSVDGCQATERHQQLETESATKVGVYLISLSAEFWTTNKCSNYTMSYQKQNICFLIITFANVDQFLKFFH